MGSRLSPELAQVLQPIIEKAEPKFLTVSAKFFTPEDQKFVFAAQMISDVDVVQNFDQSLFDYIELGFTCTTADYVELLKRHRTLLCAFVLTLKDAADDPVGTNLCVMTLRVLFKDMPDLEKINQITQLAAAETAEYTANPTHAMSSQRIVVQLYDQVSFLLRKRRFNLIFRQATVQSVLYYMFNEIKKTASGTNQAVKCYIREPDNVRVYNNLIIPPLMNWGEVLSHLQDAPGLGIYNQGCNSYYSNGVFAVYPQYDLQPPSGAYTVNFYIGSQNDMLGARAYHYRDDAKNYHVLINQDMQVKRNTLEALENIGSGILRHDASMIYNGAAVLKDGKLLAQKAQIEYAAIKTQAGVLDAYGETYTPVYINDRFNRYRTMSALVAQQSTTMAFTWTGAVPFSVAPGNLVLLHHQSVNNTRVVLKSVQCTCGSAIYSIRPMMNGPLGRLFGCTASIVLNCHNET